MQSHFALPDLAMADPSFGPTIEAYAVTRVGSGNMVDLLLNGDQIFPAMLNALIALKALGYPSNHPQVVRAVRELKNLEHEEKDTVRIEPCFSPVWDTAIAALLRAKGWTIERQFYECDIFWNADFWQRLCLKILRRGLGPMFLSSTHNYWCLLASRPALAS